MKEAEFKGGCKLESALDYPLGASMIRAASRAILGCLAFAAGHASFASPGEEKRTIVCYAEAASQLQQPDRNSKWAARMVIQDQKYVLAQVKGSRPGTLDWRLTMLGMQEEVSRCVQTGEMGLLVCPLDRGALSVALDSGRFVASQWSGSPGTTLKPRSYLDEMLDPLQDLNALQITGLCKET